MKLICGQRLNDISERLVHDISQFQYRAKSNFVQKFSTVFNCPPAIKPRNIKYNTHKYT
jgi:hypothetical protein